LLADLVHVDQFDPVTDTDSMRACYRIMEAARPVDHPCLPPQSFEGFCYLWELGGSPQQAWLASDDSGEPLAFYQLMLPDRDNAAIALVGLVVSPARRRAGIGTALLEHCSDRARQAGRVLAASSDLTRTKVRDGSPGGSFAAAVGARTGLAELISIQEIGQDLPGRLEGVRTAAAQSAAGYELVSWRGPSPAEHLEQVTRVGAAMSDAPRDAGREPDTWDASRIAATEQAAAARGQHLYSVAARRAGAGAATRSGAGAAPRSEGVAASQSEAGEFAAMTKLSADPATPGWGSQGITVVRPQDRGHRLGLFVKIAMLDLVMQHEPGLRRILTGNAESNVHMTRINAELGYKVCGVYRSWELDLPRT
jgi:GNAT superfamily N-acetyltransferase/RimJ/RimL family protein N-acetyltransferase